MYKRQVFGGERVLGGESKLCGYVSYEWACRVGNNDAELWFERKIAEHNNKI